MGHYRVLLSLLLLISLLLVTGCDWVCDWFPNLYKPMTLEWRWPTDNPSVVQYYAVPNPAVGNRLHTGIDVRDSQVACHEGAIGGCSPVYAAATGVVTAVCPNGKVCSGFSTNSDNHNMQGVVLLKHTLPDGRTVFSLYAHLGEIDEGLQVDQTVSIGTLLGTTGVYLRDGRWVSHVHFEIKDQAVLHNPSGGDACTYGGTPGPCWGYTPGHPDDYGYHDPELYLPPNFEVGDVVKVINTGDSGLNVRNTPGGTVIDAVPDGWTFRIIGGPRSATLGGKDYSWWEVREEEYETSPIKGWVAEDFLEVISAAALVPDTPPAYFTAAHEQVEGAISWATSSERKQENWKNLCLGFVAKAFGVSSLDWGCPQPDVNNCPIGGVEKLKREGRFYPAEDSWNPPRGALIFFSGEGKDPQAGLDYEKCGHIGIHLGNGRVVHAYGVARIDDIAGSEGIEQLSYIGSYIGWAYPPPEWLTEKARQIRRLTSNPSEDLAPTWSPDGRTIVFLSNRVNSQDGYDLFTINPDGTNERELARFMVTDPWGGRFADPSWLGMTGDLLVVDHKYYWEVMRFRLSQATRLPVTRDVWDGDSPFFIRLFFVPGGQGASSPVTSRDGSKLAWAALVDNWSYVPPETRNYEVRMYEGSLDSFIGDTDKAGQVVFKTEPGGFIEGTGSIAFSPDGTKLCIAAAVRGWAEGRGRDLYIVDLATGESQRLTRTGEQGMDNAGVTWSANDVIAFTFGSRTESTHDLYLIRPDGTGLAQLTDTPWDEVTSCWSPDGTYLAFASNREGNYDIYVIEAQ